MKVRQTANVPGTGIELRGDPRALVSYTGHEVVLSGPRDTGKTVACCVKGHLWSMAAPGAQGAIIRKTQASLPGTVLQTWARIAQGVHAYGGERPERYIYKNGSTVWCAGMDNPAKALSSERDWIYVCQAEELTEADWETLAGCCSGRGAVVQHPQIFADCNPAGSKHWIRERARQGKLKLLVARHEDNPQLFDVAGNLTAGGKARLGVLQSYTGIRRKRLYEGVWATAEGAVYENFDSRTHVVQRDPKEFVRFNLALDEGFTNPWVILLVGEDADRRQHVFREFHRPGAIPESVVSMARDWYTKPFPELPGVRCERCVVDASAAGFIASLNNAGVPAEGGKGERNCGIHDVHDLLEVRADGKPRLTVDPGCEETINEFESYVWQPNKEVPVKLNDHAMDALRYLQVVLKTPTGAFQSADGIYTRSRSNLLQFGEEAGLLDGGATRLRPDDF